MYFKHVLFIILLTISINHQHISAQQLQQIGNELFGTVDNEEFGFAHKISDNGERLIIGNVNIPEFNANGVVVYEKNDQEDWRLLEIISVSDSDDYVRGVPVAISDDGHQIAFYTDRSADNLSGYVSVYDWNSEEASYALRGDTFQDQDQPRYGQGVVLSGDGNTLVFQQSPINPEGEQTLLFKWDGTQWIKRDVKDIKNQDFYPYEYVLSDDGKVLAAGNLFFETIGEVRVFEEVGNTWQQRGSTILGDAPEDVLGSGGIHLSSSGDTLLIASPFDGVPNSDASGTIKVFEWSGSEWELLGNTIAYSEEEPSLGAAADISEDGRTIIAGGFGSTINGAVTGRLTAYQLKGNNWTQIGEPVFGPGNSLFAYELSASGNMETISVASYQFDDPFIDAGRIQFFQINGITTGLAGGLKPLNASVKISPNPARGQMQLEYELSDDLPLQITLVAPTGQLIRTIDSFANQMSGSHRRSISLMGIPEGTYFIRFQSGDRVLTKPVVIR